MVKKQSSDTTQTVFDRGWSTIIQRFENTLSHRNFPGPSNPDERGLIICDDTDIRLNQLVRRMRRYNPVPNQSPFGSGYRNLQLKAIVEDPVHRDSRATYFIQAVDTIAYLLYQKGQPNAYMKKVGGQAYFKRLKPILCLHAAPSHPFGIVLR